MGDKASIKDVFIHCQTGMQSHGKLVSTLTKIYDKMEFPAFWSEFCHFLKYFMIIFKREPAVERTIDFVAKFITALSKKSLTEDDDENESDHDDVSDNRLLQEMFDFLLQSHSAKDRAVRFRCCQLINKLLTNLGEDAQIDDELYDRLYECMLERLKDKWPVVRYHAVMAMSRLQDPSDENCPVIKAYLFLLNCDPNHDVRRAVLTCIAPSTKTLSSIIGRTRDVKDTVRKTAYEVLSEKIHIKALSIALRLQIVNEGLTDRSETVKRACSGKLLQAWLRTFGGNILDLLKSLDVEDSTDICSLVLETVFKTSSPQEVVERFDILSESLLIPVDQLTSESALYWQAVCKFFHGMGNEGDEFMEKVLPTCVDYCSYVQSYIDNLKTVDDPEIQLSCEFIIEHLLTIASYMDTADQASRKALENLLHKMLMADHVSHRLVKPIITRVCELKGTSEALIPFLAETVSEIREPITVVAKDIAAEERRQINLKVASIRVQLNQLREDLDDAVKAQDFEKANIIKTQVAELDSEKARLLESTETATEEIREERNDPQTILKCQTIISEMLQLLNLSGISPTLQMLIESQILPGIQNEDAEVRNMAMQALGQCCYLSKDLLVSYIPLFMQASQIDVEGVRVTALKVLFDLLHIYGLEIVDANDGSTDEENSTDSGETSDAENKSSDKNGAASKLVAIICSFLDGENSELRTCAAEGLAKLLLSGRVVSSKILSHLVLLWYNPLSEDDTYLRDCLGTFFPLYALAGRSNQEVVEEAFLPTLKTLLNAPATSPLAEVDVNNVAELLVQLTNTKLITQNQKPEETSQDNPGHDNLSERVCNEILSNPDSSNTKLWVKILSQMEISPDNEVVLKDLRILCYKMVRLVKDKTCLKSLQKFQTTVNEMASKFITNDDDLENIEIEPVAPPEPEAGEDTEEDQTEESVPRKKRVRRLHTQNLTMGLDSESEVDITQAEITDIDVDASCLDRRTSVVSSASETPSRRSRKNTTSSVVTEIAGEDDVFSVPGAPVPRKRISLGPVQTETEEEEGGDDDDGVMADDDKAKDKEGTQEPVVVLKDLFELSGKTAEISAEKEQAEIDEAERSTENLEKSNSKKGSTSKDSQKKSPVKGKENIPDQAPDKDNDVGASEPRRSLEKRRKPRSDSEEEIPAKSPKRPEKSPGSAKDAESKSPRRSLEKRKSKEQGAEVPSKSPRRSSDKSPSAGKKSPGKDVKSSTKDDKRSPAKDKAKTAGAKPGIKTSDKSAEKAASKEKSVRTSTRRSTDKPKEAGQQSPVKVRGIQSSPKTPERTLEKRKAKTDNLIPAVAKSPRVELIKSPWRQNKQATNKTLDKSPKKTSVRKNAEEPKKKTEETHETRRGVRNAAAKLNESQTSKNVRNAKNKDVAKSLTGEKETSDVDTTKSPRATRRSVSQAVAAQNQGPNSPRVSLRISSVVLDTPEPKSPASLRSRPQRSIAETPELKSPKPTNKPVKEQESKVQEKDAGKPVDMVKSRLGAKSTRGARASASVQGTANSGKEKTVVGPKATRGVTRNASTSAAGGRTTRTGASSSDDASAVSSPESPVTKKKKTVQEESVEEDSEEETQLKRKAKPSRKSLTSQIFKSPALSTRSTPTRKEDNGTKETTLRRGRSSIVGTPSTVSSQTPTSSRSTASSSQSATRVSTRRSAVATPQRSESDLDGSIFSTPGSPPHRTRASLLAAGDASKRTTRSKVPQGPGQEKKVRDAGKRAATKTLPSRAKTTRK